MVLGFVTIGLAFLAPVLGDTVIQIALSVFGMIGGPLCGVVTLALFFPCCNAIVSNCHINRVVHKLYKIGNVTKIGIHGKEENKFSKKFLQWGLGPGSLDLCSNALVTELSGHVFDNTSLN